VGPENGSLADAETSSESDPFDALLREAARASGPVSAARRSALTPGTTLAGGRLSILRKLGEGGMGTVYEAFDDGRRARVALKTLTRVDPSGVYRLKNEFRGLADATHPNLVQLHELFVDGDVWCFSMELIEGVRFDRWVRPQRALDAERLRSALAQLVAAVEAIHAVGKLHRDLKPSNVLVTDTGRLAVLDFGLAVDPEQGGAGQTLATESISGTPAYMAPEQAAGRAATAASDVYALGAMLFEALTGRLPFEGSVGEIIALKQTREAPSARALAPDAPADLCDLCSTLLTREPAHRPTLAQLRSALGMSGSAQSPREQSRVAGAQDTPLLGRELELDALRDAYAASLAGTPVVLFLSGESGLGKSALLERFVQNLLAEGHASVLSGRCYEREHVPYNGLDALIDALSRHLRRLLPQQAAALMPRAIYALARIFPALERVQVVAEVPRKELSDPQDLKRRAFEALHELLGRMRDRAPLVLVIDDLQWIDQDSLGLLRALLLQPAPVPFLLVCAHRSEGASQHALLRALREGAEDNGSVALRDLALGPLPQAALVELLRGLMPAADAAQADAFAREAQGSPFFAEQLVRCLPRRQPSDTKLSLRDALSLHIAALPEAAQRLLALLATAAQPLSPQLACAALGLADGHAQVDRLRAAQLVRVSVDPDGGRNIECYHDKIREQLLSQLAPAQARELARELATALLQQPDRDPELLARTLDMSGDPERAAEFTARAAERAFQALAFSHAAALYTRALERGRFSAARAQALRIAQAEALAHAGRGQLAGEAFTRAAQAAQPELREALMCKAGEQYLLCGELELGREALARVLRQVGVSFPRSLLGAILSVLWSRLKLSLTRLRHRPRTEHAQHTLRELQLLGTVTHGLARSDQLRAADFCARWVRAALRAGHTVELARALAWELLFASSLQASGARIKRIHVLSARLCEASGDKLAAITLAMSNGQHQLMRAGNSDAALAHFERELALIETSPGTTSSYDRLWAQYFRGTALFLRGDVALSGEIAEQHLEYANACQDHTVSTPFAALVCMARTAAGRTELAARVLEPAAQRFRPGRETLQDWIWLSVEALPALYRGDARAAWYAAEPQRSRFFASFQGRFVLPGILENWMCGVAYAASLQAVSPEERRLLRVQAERLGRRARGAMLALCPGVAPAVLACMRNDRAQAISALRERLNGKLGPLNQHVIRRRLGELLDDSEGQALIAAADAALRAGGVVDPARFSACMLPGIELSP
jgi:eukaryotic-like serine/threonine-protein kinase